MVTVAVVQPYLPAYRVGLFAEVVELLRQDSVGLRVITGSPTPKQAERKDSVHGLEWQVETHSRHLHVHGRWLRTHSAWRHWRGADAVVVELAGGLLDTYVALMRRDVDRVAVWGHVGQAQPGAEQRLIQGQCRRADHVFAYTDAGAQRVVGMGVDPSAVSAVHNAIDTSVLSREVRQGEWDDKTFAYIGALDETKRLDLLVRVVEGWIDTGVRARLLIGGDGPGRAIFDRADFRDHVVFFGRVDDSEKASMLSSAAAILCPGRVGLLAVDSLAAGVPILTMQSDLHAPELEYLSPGRTCIVSPPDDDAYLRTVAAFTGDRGRLTTLRTACRAEPAPTVEQAAARMVAGIHVLLGSARRVSDTQRRGALA